MPDLLGAEQVTYAANERNQREDGDISPVHEVAESFEIRAHQAHRKRKCQLGRHDSQDFPNEVDLIVTGLHLGQRPVGFVLSFVFVCELRVLCRWVLQVLLL